MKTKLNVIMVGLISLSMTACGPNTGARTQNVGLQFSSFTTTQNKRLEFLKDLFFPKAYATVSNLKFCFKRLRFKGADVDTSNPAADADNKDFPIGLVTISNASTSLGNVTIPAGDYKRVEFDLEDSCGTGASISLTNTNGTYSTNSRVTIKFRGDFVLSSDGTLNLGVQNILTQLNTYNGVGLLKDSAEAISGVLTN